MARPTSWAATKRRIFTLPVSGSTSMSQNWVAKPGATTLGFTDPAATIGPPVVVLLAAISLSVSGFDSATVLLAVLAQAAVPHLARARAQRVRYLPGGFARRGAGREGDARAAGDMRISDRRGVGDDR